MKEAAEKSLDPKLWHACAGGMVQMPSVNSKVFYFPQGHAEHAQAAVDFGCAPRIPPLIACRVAGVKFLADPESDEVFAKVKLVPLGTNELDSDDDGGYGVNGAEIAEKPASFAKTLTQSDANNGGGFSVPRYCAETIFPRLDYSADPPVQTVIAKDVHGEIWKFRHIYRGTPRRHLLTTGWSTFVNQKKLVAGDSIVFLRDDRGELCVGIRRASRTIGYALDCSPGWGIGSGNCAPPYGGFSMFLKGDESKFIRNGYSNSSSGGNPTGRRRVSPESVMEEVSLAASGRPFEIVYYPRASTPEFCVRALSVRTAMRIQWCSGMRFKMAFETEDSSRISWFMGTISAVQVADPLHWPNSPWRLLQVNWDEPDLLQNVKRVNPWLVELVPNSPVIHLSPFSPPRKKLRIPSFSEPPLDGQFAVTSFLNNPVGPSLGDFTTPTGIQGARHSRFGLSLSNLHANDKLQLGLFPSNLHPLDLYPRVSDTNIKNEAKTKEKSLSSFLTMGNSCEKPNKSENVKRHQFVLFGQPIVTEQQISIDSSAQKAKPLLPNGSELGGVDIGQCKVFMESEDVGLTLDLSAFTSFDDLYKQLATVFGVETSDGSKNMLYQDLAGAVKHIGDEPFSDFKRTARRLEILKNSANIDTKRTWIARMRNAGGVLEASNKRGPLSIFA